MFYFGEAQSTGNWPKVPPDMKQKVLDKYIHMPMPSARPKFFWPAKKIFGWPKLFGPSFLYRILMDLIGQICFG